MRTRSNSVGDAAAWEPYVPSNEAPWNRARVAHLHRRAGFAANWATLERDLRDGPFEAVTRLLAGEASSVDGQARDAFEVSQLRLERYAAASGNLSAIQAAWLYRMIFTPAPLLERITLFWHNHFATSFAKVNSSRLMTEQIGLLRSLAFGRFSVLLKAIARDPAMLLWLDSSTNRKAHPNENYAREVMELFTLGRGQYSETDIREAARAFTGAFIQGDRYREVPGQHDSGAKTILGKTGPFRGDDVAEILLDQEACAPYVCRKLYRHFVDESSEPEVGLIEPLAQHFRNSEYEVAALVERILRSRHFFEARTLHKRVKSPVEFAVGLVRCLEIVNPTVGTEALAQASLEMGQSLYAPPSVAGWEGGAEWINTSTSLARANLALALVSSSDEKLGRRFDPLALASKYGASSGESTAQFYLDLLVQDGPSEFIQAKLREAIEKNFDSPEGLRQAISLVLTSPEYQLA
jgi:uncharacterized protein (DUF1800 family)